MRAFTSLFLPFSITALATCGLLMQLAQAQIRDQKCVPQLNPATCSSAGNSVCNALGVGGCPDDECHYCDDPSTPVASKICMEWEGETCQIDPNQKKAECDSMANWKIGTCGLNGTCLCLNQVADGPCGTEVYAYPCITP